MCMELACQTDWLCTHPQCRSIQACMTSKHAACDSDDILQVELHIAWIALRIQSALRLTMNKTAKLREILLCFMMLHRRAQILLNF